MKNVRSKYSSFFFENFTLSERVARKRLGIREKMCKKVDNFTIFHFDAPFWKYRQKYSSGTFFVPPAANLLDKDF